MEKKAAVHRVSPEVLAAISHVPEAWCDGTEVRFEFMNIPEVWPLVKMFSAVTRSSIEYCDTHAGETTRFRWTLPLAQFQPLFRAWTKADKRRALPLRLRLPKKVS
jgi:hypothetical protein